MTVEQRYNAVLKYFAEAMPEPKTELRYRNPYELLVAVILSAQCTDRRVNIVTPALFEAFPTPVALASATSDQIFEYIKSVSFPNNKTKSLHRMANMLVNEFGGNVPSDIDDLMKLPGVGRKTANVILSVIYDKPAMAVDTHVFRVSERIGLTTNSRNPHQTELRLLKSIPAEQVARAHHWLILHGRYVCKARKPDCQECGIRSFCRFYTRQSKNSDK